MLIKNPWKEIGQARDCTSNLLFPGDKFFQLTHYQMTNFRLFQTERGYNFIFDAKGRKLSKQVENTVGKGEIARYEQFLLFPQCFQKACFPGVSKGVIVWEWVKLLVLGMLAFESASSFRVKNFNCITKRQKF